MLRRAIILILVLINSVAYCSQIDFLLSGLKGSFEPLASGRVYSYEAGTNTPKSIYANSSLTDQLDNPTILDMQGRVVAYGQGAYKFIVKDSQENTVISIDNYVVPSATELSAEDPFGPILTQTEIDSTTITVQNLQVSDLTVLHDSVFTSLELDGVTRTSWLPETFIFHGAVPIGQDAILLEDREIDKGILFIDGDVFSLEDTDNLTVVIDDGDTTITLNDPVDANTDYVLLILEI